MSGWAWQLPNHPSNFCGGNIFANDAAGLQWLYDERVKIDGIYALMNPQQA